MERRPLTGEKELEFLAQLAQPTGRRSFLKWSGVTLAVAVAGCRDDGPTGTATDGKFSHGAATISLGSGNFAVLNYALTLERLEAEFYTRAIGTPAFNGLSADGKEVFRDLRSHEVIHRDYLIAAISALGGTPVPDLEFTFPEAAFNDTEVLLELARTFEDLGVSAYNGAAQLFSNDALGATLLTVAGKIVSVEARHASAIRDLIHPNTGFFAADVSDWGELGVVNEQGLDVVRVPSMVLPLANPFIVGDITDPHILDASGLPTPEYVPESPTAPINV